MGLMRAAIILAAASIFILPAMPAPANAAAGTTYATLPSVLRFKSAEASYNDIMLRYEGVLDQSVRFDFSPVAGWDRNLSASLYFIATMDPDYEKKVNIYYGREREVDFSLAGVKHLDDSRLVATSYSVEPASITTGEIAARGSAVTSVSFTFRTAGSWKIYIVYGVAGSDFLAAESELARIYINGNPDAVSTLNSLLSLLLLVPMMVQAFRYFRTRFSRKRAGSE
jgi:hypothetical protein